MDLLSFISLASLGALVGSVVILNHFNNLEVATQPIDESHYNLVEV